MYVEIKIEWFFFFILIIKIIFRKYDYAPDPLRHETTLKIGGF